MFKRILLLTGVLGAVGASPAFAASTFQDTCSQIAYTYSGNAPAISAVCLMANGTAHATSLTLAGISNQNGVLTQGSGASSFQQSCGNIQIAVTMTTANLTAFCRTAAGAFLSQSLALNNISNQNGTLTQ